MSDLQAQTEPTPGDGKPESPPDAELQAYLQHLIEGSAPVIPEAETSRFCGAWSVPERTVRLAIGEVACESEFLVTQARQRVAAYTAETRALLAELEEKLPGYEHLPFWRELLAFYERVAMGWHLPSLLDRSVRLYLECAGPRGVDRARETETQEEWPEFLRWLAERRPDLAAKPGRDDWRLRLVTAILAGWVVRNQREPPA
jgi:hypothetical protein